MLFRSRMGNLKAGDSIKIVYAERLNADGSLYRENLRHALSTDSYIASGKETGGWWSPVFTYHGFRYVEITGLKNITKEDVVAEVVSDEMDMTGSFSCADPILNKVYENGRSGVRSPSPLLI